MKEVISYRQSVLLLSMILPVTGHMILVPTMFELSGRDSWISIFLTMPFGFFFGFVLHRLHILHPEKTLVEMMESGFGKIAGKVVSTGLLIYFVYMLVITFYALFDFIQVIFLPEASSWSIALAFYLAVLYAVRVGIESIARMSTALFLIIVITGVSIGIANQPEKDYKLLLPLFENGFAPALLGMLATTALFGEFIILTMLRMRKDHARSKSLFFTNTVLVLLITWMFEGTVTTALGIFGVEQATNQDYPAQSIVRLTTFGFIERFDIYGIAVMVLGCIVRMSTFHIILNEGVRKWLGIKGKWWIHAAVAILVFAVGLKGIKNHQQFLDVYMNQLYPMSAVISVGLPLLVWIILEIKHQRQKNKKACPAGSDDLKVSKPKTWKQSDKG